MAYFCLTILQGSGDRKKAAKKYGIKLEVLNKIAQLSSERGGQQARKASGKKNDLTEAGPPFSGGGDQGSYSPGSEEGSRP